MICIRCTGCCSFSNDDLIITSDSLVIVTECLKILGIEKIVNKDVAYIKAWNASGLPNCPFTDELIIKGVFTSQVGSSIHGNWTEHGLMLN